MKKIVILLLISLKMISQNPNFIKYDANVTMFCKLEPNSKTYVKLDTIVNDPTRKIKIANDDSEFEIGFPVDSEIVYINFKVGSKGTVHHKDGKEYSYYMGYDEDEFPLTLYISKDKLYSMLYYFYTEEINEYSKCEKLKLKKID